MPSRKTPISDWVDKGDPDPLRMELGNAIVEVCLLRCNKDSKHSFDTQWDNIPWPYPTE